MRVMPRSVLGGQLPRETRDTWFLLAVIGWIVLLQTPYLPAWCSAMALAVLAWRAWLAARSRPLPAWPWRLALLLGALGGVWASHRTLLGQDAGVTLIVVLLAIIGSTDEVRNRVGALADIGVTDFAAVEFGATPEEIAETRDALKGLLA